MFAEVICFNLSFSITAYPQEWATLVSQVTHTRARSTHSPSSPRACACGLTWPDGWRGNSAESATRVRSGSWRHHTVTSSFMMYWQSGNIVEPTAAPEGFCQLNDLKSPKCEPGAALRPRIIGLRFKWDISSCFRSLTFGMLLLP